MFWSGHLHVHSSFSLEYLAEEAVVGKQELEWRTKGCEELGREGVWGQPEEARHELLGQLPGPPPPRLLAPSFFLNRKSVPNPWEGDTRIYF